MRILRGLVLVLTLLLPASALAQDDYFTQHARPVMDRLMTSWTRRGFERVGDFQTGVLGVRDRDSLTVRFEDGWQYAALAMCDEDCGDVDLYLFGADGKRVAFEATSNPRSALRVLSPTAGVYRLEVVMMKCSTPPCYYGVQWLRGAPTPAPAPRP